MCSSDLGAIRGSDMAINKIQLRNLDMLILAFQDSGIRGRAGAGRTVGRTPAEIGTILAEVPKALRYRTGYGLEHDPTIRADVFAENMIEAAKSA